MDVAHQLHGRTSEADAFDIDDATTVATVALAAAVELADPPDASPFGLGAFLAAAAFGAALGSWKNGHALPRMQVPLDQKIHGTLGESGFGFALAFESPFDFPLRSGFAVSS